MKFFFSCEYTIDSNSNMPITICIISDEIIRTNFFFYFSSTYTYKNEKRDKKKHSVVTMNQYAVHLLFILLIFTHIIFKENSFVTGKVFFYSLFSKDFFLLGSEYELVWMRNTARRIESCRWWCIFFQGYCRCLRCR
jgi:hypothetical protein